MDLASQLSALVTELRNPTNVNDQRTQKLRKVSYYLPQIKNPQNLWLVLNELALSPGLWAQGEDSDLRLTFLAVDAITYSANRKQQISDPTLSFREWEAELVRIAYRLPPLIGLVVIAGLCARNSPVELDLVRFLETVANNSQQRELNLLAAACLSRAQWSHRVTDKIIGQITSQCRSNLFETTIDTIYSHRTVQLLDPNIAGEFGGWSRMLAYLLNWVELDQLEQYLQKLELYVRTAVSFEPSVETIKPVTFGLTIQLEGLMAQVVRNRNIRPVMRNKIVNDVLKTLQPLGFVFETVGSQFDSYLFVLNSCLDSLQYSSVGDRMQVVHSLGEHWSFGQTISSDVSAGDLLFFFEVSEQLMPILPAKEAELKILAIAQRFLKPPPPPQPGVRAPELLAAVFEAAHSVMLAYLATHQSHTFSKSISALEYFDSVMPLFPNLLSATQFRTAVEAILNAVEKDKHAFILNNLFTAAKSTIPGQPLPVTKNSPPTIRSAYISALLHGVANHCDAPDMTIWLDKISTMVPGSYSPATQQEREYLIQDFKDVVTSLGNFADVGIKWFFNDGWSRL